MNPKKLADHFRKEAAFVRGQQRVLSLHGELQTLAACPGCGCGTRGGQLCPGCLEALAELLEPKETKQ